MTLIQNETILHTVQEKLQKTDITEADILSVTELNLSRKNLTEVSDLERFTNLANLDLVENCLTDLSPLAGLKNLRRLAAGNDPFLSDEDCEKRLGINHFTDYSFLASLPNLVDVDFTATGDDNIEYAQYLPNVEEFRAYCNPITDISPLIRCKSCISPIFTTAPSPISACTDISRTPSGSPSTVPGSAISRPLPERETSPIWMHTMQKSKIFPLWQTLNPCGMSHWQETKYGIFHHCAERQSAG